MVVPTLNRYCRLRQSGDGLRPACDRWSRYPAYALLARQLLSAAYDLNRVFLIGSDNLCMANACVKCPWERDEMR